MKKILLLGSIILIIIVYIVLIFQKISYKYETTIICSSNKYYFDDTYKVELDNDLGSVMIEKKEENVKSSSEYCIKGTFNKNGKSVMTLIDSHNNRIYFDLKVNNKSFEINELDDSSIYLSKIKMSIKNNTLTKKGCTLIINDETGLNNIYGEYFYIEKYENENWNQLEKKQEAFFNDIGYELNNNKVEINTNWYNIYGELEIGKYRIVKEITIDSKKYSFDTEFEIK